MPSNVYVPFVTINDSPESGKILSKRYFWLPSSKVFTDTETGVLELNV